MSQLGMMVMSIGLSSYNIALFHLMNHAFYKALLFLGAGSVIHAVADNQDFRKFGGLISYLPLTYSVMLIASLSLVAFPFMTGFYSKDFILESAYGQFSFSGIAVYIIATIGAIFTTLYSVKVLYLTFLVNPNGPRIYYSLPIDNLFNSTKSYKPAHEGDLFLSLPLVILALFSIFFGFITKDIFIGLGSNFFADNSLFIHPIHEIMIDTEFAVSVLFKLLPFICTISFSILALTLSELFSELIIYFKLSRLGYNIFGFFNQRFLIEFFYNKYITNLILNLGGQITKILDKGSIEFFGPFGLEKGLLRLSKNISYLSTSNVTTYALYILVSFIIYIIIYYVQYNICILLVIMLLSIGNGDKKTDIAREIDYNYYNKQLLKNPITYIYNSKKMFSTTAYLLNSSDSDSSSDSESVDNSNPVYSGDESAPVPAPSSVPANNNNNNNENNNNNNDNGDSNYESDASSDSATTSSSINTVFNKLKDKSDEEINQYFEDKQRKLDRTRDQEQANNSPISDFDYVDEIADQIDAKHEDRSKALQDRKEIVKEYVDAYRNDRNVFEDMDVDRSQPSEGETLKEDSTNKRKFEEESEDEGQPSEAKRPKQDSSDITGDTEPFDFGGGDD
jgi:NADH-ubiquinone oxidoreductase chain 5